jgi:hypothetical protein
MKSYEEIKDAVLEFFEDEDYTDNKSPVTLDTVAHIYSGWSPHELFDTFLSHHFDIILWCHDYPNVLTIKDYIDLIYANQK